MKKRIENMKLKALSVTIRVLNVVFAALTFGLLFVAVFRPGLVTLFLAWLEGEIGKLGNWNYLIAFSSALIESFPIIGVLVPGMQIMLIVGGFFGRDNLSGVIVCAMTGAIVGNWTGYLLGIRQGSAFFKNYGDWFGVGTTELKILKKQIQKNGAIFVIAGKFHNLTRSFVPFIAGSMGMRKDRFWTYNIVGSAVWAVTIIVCGIIFAQYYRMITNNMKYILGGLAIILTLYISLFKRAEFLQYLRDKNAEIDEKIAEKEKKGPSKTHESDTNHQS